MSTLPFSLCRFDHNSLYMIVRGMKIAELHTHLHLAVPSQLINNRFHIMDAYRVMWSVTRFRLFLVVNVYGHAHIPIHSVCQRKHYSYMGPIPNKSIPFTFCTLQDVYLYGDKRLKVLQTGE